MAGVALHINQQDMPVFKSKALMAQLKQEAKQILARVSALQEADNEILNRQPAPESWSIAQVLEHLNFYSRLYNHRLRQRMNAAGSAKDDFKPGWLGNYFTKMMLPKAGGVVVNKMSAPKDSRPVAQLDGAAVVREFIAHQEQLLALMDNGKDLSVRVPTSISSLIKLQAGDTMRFLVTHQQRHLAQAERAAKAIGYPW
jgi:uncharacterized damage-inducible protein DinB